MIYIKDIYPNLPEGVSYLGSLQVEYVQYIIDNAGRIEISIRTDNPNYNDYLKNLENSSQEKIEYIDTEYIKPADIYEIYYTKTKSYIEEFWILHSRQDSGHLGISTICEPTNCPLCNQKLIQEEDGIYCFNSRCPAKLKTTIKRFLAVLCNEPLHFMDFNIIDTLIQYGILTTPTDLFLLNKGNLISLNFKHEFIDSLLDKIDGIKQTVTVSKYLRSLNIDPKNYVNPLNKNNNVVWIDWEVVDMNFTAIEQFLDWWKFIYESKQSPFPYMSEAAYIALSNFLEIEENFKTIYELREMDIFV